MGGRSMSVYVDDAFIEAKVARFNSRWCHLTADSEQELVEFARGLGLKASYLQNSGRPSFHFDVTEGKRKHAVAAGAIEIGWRDFGELIVSRRNGGGL